MAKERTYFTTPPAEVRWADTIKPNNRFSPPGEPGVYSVQVLLDPERPDHADFLKGLEDLWKGEYASECRQQNKKQIPTHDKPWKADTGDDGTPTGLIVIRPKNKEWFHDRHGARVNVEIDMFDAKKTPIRVQIGNGSVCRVNFEAFGFFHAGKFGVSLRLRAVQVLDLVEYDRNYGFDETDGYEGQRYEPPAEEPETAAATNGQDTRFEPDDELPF